MREDIDHLAVVTERLGHESLKAVVTTPRPKVLEQQSADAAPLPTIGDHEGRLGLARARHALVSRHADDLTGATRDKRFSVAMVDNGEPGQLRGAQLRMRREEPHADRLGAERSVKALQPCEVSWLDGAYLHDCPVGEQGISRAVSRRGRAHGHDLARTPRPSRQPRTGPTLRACARSESPATLRVLRMTRLRR